MKITIDKTNYLNTIYTIESHTVGEPTRIIVEGFPEAAGETMMEKKKYLEKKYDFLRSSVMCEPRGHKDMVGAVLTPPVNKDANLGVLFMDAYRWINMCGHASIGCAYVAVQTGLVARQNPYTDVILDTPAGKVTVRVDSATEECTLYNVPSFLILKDCSVTMQNKTILFDVAFGGTFFALVRLEDTGFSFESLDVSQLVNYAKDFLKIANEKYQVKHPIDDISQIVNVEFYQIQNAATHSYKNIVISEQGEIDRSPCGTGTSAELSALFTKGEINKEEQLYNENFLGALFKAQVMETTKIGNYDAIIPAITGKAYITGKSEYYLSKDDPLKYGFNIF